MPAHEEIEKIVRRYLRTAATGTGEEIAELYTVEATLEDPVGTPAHVGRRQIAEFYESVRGGEREIELLTLRIAAKTAAFHFRVTTKMGDTTVVIEPIDVMEFDDDARIVSMADRVNESRLVTIGPSNARVTTTEGIIVSMTRPKTAVHRPDTWIRSSMNWVASAAVRVLRCTACWTRTGHRTRGGLRLYHGREDQIMTAMLPSPFLTNRQKLRDEPEWAGWSCGIGSASSSSASNRMKETDWARDSSALIGAVSRSTFEPAAVCIGIFPSRRTRFAMTRTVK